MIQKLRVRLARWILGGHCECYRMGYHHLVDREQRCKDLAVQDLQRKTK